MRALFSFEVLRLVFNVFLKFFGGFKFFFLVVFFLGVKYFGGLILGGMVQVLSLFGNTFESFFLFCVSEFKFLKCFVFKF